jgi:hypothetical protein
MQPLDIAEAQVKVTDHDEERMYEPLQAFKWDFEKVRSACCARPCRDGRRSYSVMCTRVDARLMIVKVFSDTLVRVSLDASAG